MQVLAVPLHWAGIPEPRMSDEALMRALAKGDADAGRELARRLMPRCKRVVRAVVGAHRDFDDIVQQCLIDVLRGAASFRGEASLETWASRICVRRAIKAVNRSRRNLEDVDAKVDAESLRAEEDAARLLSERLPRPLERYLEELGPLHREAIVLRYGLGYAVAEIAEMTGAKPNTIKVRLFQGLKKLRAQVEHDLTDDRSRRR